jgi:hypothetical protein
MLLLHRTSILLSLLSKDYIITIKFIFTVKSDEKEAIPSLLLLRKSLPRLREGEEVLARWADEGWYFRGK